MVSRVQDRLNLTSASSTTRIGTSINEYYARAVTSCGIQTSTRTVATASTTIGNRTVTFGPSPITVEKIYSVFNPQFAPPAVLNELTFEEIRNDVVGTDPASDYAIQLMGDGFVSIFLDSTPTTSYVLNADVQTNTSILSGTMTPVLPTDFHYMLMYGAMAVELTKMEKYDMAQAQDEKFEAILSSLKLYIAVSAYKDIYQGKTAGENLAISAPLVT